MSLLPRGNAWCGEPSLRLVVASVVLLFVGTGFGLEAGAQPTTLRLIDQVSEPGARTVPGDTLSGDARVAVLRRETDRVRAYALSNLNFNRKDVKRRIQKGNAETFRLTGGGRTPQAFGQTGASGNVYYVLALTREGKLLESYVNAGNRSYLPGFGIVASGDMPMGPVAKEHREPLRAALKSAVGPMAADRAAGDPAERDSATEDSSGKKQEKRLGAENGGSGRGNGGGYVQMFLGALPSWFGALVLGLLIGGAGAWVVYRKYKKELSRKKRKIGRLQRKIYNKSNKKSIYKDNSVHKKVLDKKKEKIKELTKDIERKETKISRLERKLDRSGNTSSRETPDQKPWKEVSSTERSQRSTAGASPERSSQQDPADRTADLIGRAFVNWCNDAGAAMVDRHSMFANKLQDSLPGAELQRIFREKNAAGIVFADDVQDAVEYWHVRVDGQDFLLPQPHRSGFREVEECFQADCTTPNQIQEFEPAELQSSGGEYELKSEGMLA